MKTCFFTNSLAQLNNCLPYFPPDCMGQIVIDLTDEELKEIFCHIISNLWRKQMTKHGFEIQVENLDAPASYVKKLYKKKKRKRIFQETESSDLQRF